MSTDTTEQAPVVRLLVAVPPDELATVLTSLAGFTVTPLTPDQQPGPGELVGTPMPIEEPDEDEADEESTESLASRMLGYEKRVIQAALRRNAYHPPSGYGQGIRGHSRDALQQDASVWDAGGVVAGRSVAGGGWSWVRLIDYS